MSRVSILVDLDNLPPETGVFDRRHPPLGADNFDLLSCAAACTVIFGLKVKGTFVPLALGRTRRLASAAQWRR